MRITRLYTPQALAVDSEIELGPDGCRRLSQVLRLQAGAELLLFNGDGRDYPARLLRSDRRACRVLVTGQGEPEGPPRLVIELALGISRPERMDLALQKAVELGVSGIQPLLLAFCNQRQQGDWREKKARHWRQIILSACEQSGRRWLPQLAQVTDLEGWLGQPPADGPELGLDLVLDPGGGQTLADLSAPAAGRPIRLLVGPEGGLAADEIQACAKRGFSPIRLGPRVLRTETAPLAAIAALQALWGDFC
ncbi:16S rRNA (uracil(1498)-N(3))-methyltransferase [Magnetovirga frankeli]|uniref:16S rRNA (uracil(1498)-N(3))-methyltransferase n=1 Tax=Magnetovirga frankeli TaxID=947516 RepID=UPI001292DFA1|nr:16S rRNA (uracil(1498)-N(3))-methyltransferase [gamma proteobacterium SS-5]